MIVVDPPEPAWAPTQRLYWRRSQRRLWSTSRATQRTLARDLRALTGSGYAIESLTLADLFPQTFHLETVVHLRRR